MEHQSVVRRNGRVERQLAAQFREGKVASDNDSSSAIAAVAAESSERLLLRTEQPLLGFC